MPHFENNYATRGAPILSPSVLRDFSDRAHLAWPHLAAIRQRWPGQLVVKGILTLISELGADGMTMVVVTHEMGFARSAADSVVFMDGGRVIETGTPEQIFESAETQRLRQFLAQVV